MKNKKSQDKKKDSNIKKNKKIKLEKKPQKKEIPKKEIQKKEKPPVEIKPKGKRGRPKNPETKKIIQQPSSEQKPLTASQNTALATATISGGVVTGIAVTYSGSGYISTSVPQVLIEPQHLFMKIML